MPSDPLNQPVRVVRVYPSGVPAPVTHGGGNVEVNPHHVLAALDDDARAKVAWTIARAVSAEACRQMRKPDDWDTMTHAEKIGWANCGMAAMTALCGERLTDGDEAWMMLVAALRGVDRAA